MRTKVFILSIVILLTFSLILGMSNWQDERNVELSHQILKERGLNPHSPIRINSDTEFDQMAQQEGWSGSGGYLSPYIIENYEIDGNGATSFFIGNTTRYFIIRYSHFYNSTSTDRYNSGTIEFYNVQNGYVTGCNVTDSNYGIYLTAYTSGTQVTYSEFYSVTYGVYIYFHTTSSTISNNNFHYSVHVGTAITTSYSSTDNEIWYNTIDGPSRGIFLDGINGACTGNIIERNTITNLGDYGVYVYSTYGKNRVENNTISNSNYEGIRVYSLADDTRIVNNSIKNCYSYGIEIALSNNALVYNNTLKYNNGTNNRWDYKGRENYWSDWTTPDNNHDGIVDAPYVLDGDPDSQDNYPLVEPTIPEIAPMLLIGVLIILGIYTRLRR